MRLRSLWVSRLVLSLMLLATVGSPIVAAQDATPEGSPVVETSPDASPVTDASPAADASPVAASCVPGPSVTAAEQIALDEERYEIEQPANTEGTYVTGTIGDLQSVNPYIVEEQTSLAVVGYIFDTLTGGDSQTGQPVPGGVTDHWVLGEDCVTYTFHLRQDKVWHDGTPFTSADVAFSFESLSDPALASPYTGSFLDAVASWNVIDDYTIEIVSNGVRADFLNNAAFFIIPKHIWESVPRDQWATDPGSTGQDTSRVVGTGPFTFQSWEQGQEIRLARYEGYTPRPAWISEVVLRIFADSEAQLNAFLTGELDDIGLEPEQVSVVEADTDQFSIEAYPYRGFTYYEFNLNPDTTVRFQDVRVRQAFMWAIDRQSIVDNILLGYGEVANGTQPSISYAYAPDQIDTIYTYDPDRARALLAEAGWTDTNGDGTVDKDGVEMAFEFLYPSGSATNDTLVAYLQDAWSQVGIGITPIAMEFSALIEATTTNPTFEMALYGFGWDSTFIQDVMFACDMYQIGFNDMKYCNPELDALGEQIKVTVDQDQRRALMIQYSNIVNEEQPVGIINFSVQIAAWNNRVHNYFPNAWGGLGVTYIWIEE
ncbi:MAG: ABC transporter substrate-binding protein [Chloroflexota bacterium]|nr:ABC transporter substrate-binding protein [Chloroflexota bacterium]